MASQEGTRYLSMALMLALHEEVIRLTGSGPAPLRDEGLLESALLRLRMAAYYEQADVIRQCALLAVSVSQAESFVDGNKRTAYAAADVFLRLNGMQYTGDPIELARQLEAIAGRADSLEDATNRFEHWLRGRGGPREAAPPTG